MPLHFSTDELAERRRRAIDAAAAQGLHGLLLFKQESLYYLTGHDTFGFCFFQCLYLGCDGRMTLVSRMPDGRAARLTSVIEDIRPWPDAPDTDPANSHVRPLLEEHGCRGKRIGVEWEAHGLTGRNARRLVAAVEGLSELEDASELVSRLRAVKSPAEIAYVRRAAALADDALDEALKLARPGAFEGDILSAMQGAVFKGDGDYPGNPFIIASGPSALVGRYHTGRRTLGADDVLSLEFAGVYRQYHAPLWRTIKVGKDNPRHREMWALGVAALEACRDAIRPGRPVADVFAAYAKAIERGGYGRALHHSVGYSVGATYAPSWMDWPMLYRGNPEVLRPGMTLFLHPSVRDEERKLAALPGETVLVTERGAERLSRHRFDYLHAP
jgi:Xaa-Pro dipeptidase